MSASKLSDQTRAALDAAIAAAYNELGQPDYKAVSAAVRTVVKTAVRQLEKASKKDVTGDTRERAYTLVKLQIWDVTAGEDKADLEGEAEPQEGLIGLRSVFVAVADLVASFHDGSPPVEITIAHLEDKMPSLRTMLATNNGHTAYRLRYDFGKAAYLIYMEVQREGSDATLEPAEAVAEDDDASEE